MKKRFVTADRAVTLWGDFGASALSDSSGKINPVWSPDTGGGDTESVKTVRVGEGES